MNPRVGQFFMTQRGQFRMAFDSLTVGAKPQTLTREQGAREVATKTSPGQTVASAV